MTIAGNIIQLDVTSAVAALQNQANARIYSLLVIRKIVLYCLMPFILIVVFSQQLSELINSSPAPVIFLGIAAVSMLVSSVANGFTSGLHQLSFQAGLGVFSSLVKLFAGMLLMYLAASSAGGMAAYAVGYLVIAFGSFKKCLSVSKIKDPPREVNPSYLKSGLVQLILIYIFLVSPFVLDQILIQHFNPDLGGAYSALGNIGKLIFFLSAPILSAVYTHACHSKSNLEHTRLFKLGLAGVCFVALSTLTGWSIFGHWIGIYLIPAHYHDVLPQIFLSFIGIALYCISYLLVLTAIVKKSFFIAWALIPPALAQMPLFYLRHSSVNQAVINQLCVYLIQLSGVILFILFSRFRSKDISLSQHEIAN